MCGTNGLAVQLADDLYKEGEMNQRLTEALAKLLSP
jgi:hypothetical protein